ncbi:MAG: Rpn family recombination-promoting nuclease/putative transposase [Clostridiales Family XIII bacterium]|nr:Rpn family recombination-promoting nuclease/putative transposase [Clostridiales Family XIII bacterium]
MQEQGNSQGRKLLKPKSDLVFKRVFGDESNLDILRSFLGSVLDMPEGELDEIRIVDPNLRIESEDDKLFVLDLKVKTKSGMLIDIEVQLAPFPNMMGRLLSYTGRMFAEQLRSGDRYAEVKRVVTIVVADHALVPEAHYHNAYLLMNTVSSRALTDLLQIHTLELKKLDAEGDGTLVGNWVRFLRAEKKEEFEMAAQASPEIKKAVAVIERLSGDEQLRAQVEARERAWRDRVDQIEGAREEGFGQGKKEGREEGREEGRFVERIAIARQLLSIGLAPYQICEATGLSQMEVEELSAELASC